MSILLAYKKLAVRTCIFKTKNLSRKMIDPTPFFILFQAVANAKTNVLIILLLLTRIFINNDIVILFTAGHPC